MTSSDELFQFIHSLSKTEKRYFTVYAARQRDAKKKNYVRLFNALNALGRYDEAELKEHLRRAKFTAQLPYEKHRLFEVLLRCLREFHAQKLPERKVNDLIEGAIILKDRGLYDKAEKELRKAKAIAYAHDHFLQVAHILEIENKLIKARVKRDLAAHLNRNAEERAAVVATIDNHFQYWKLYDTYFLMVRENFNMHGSQVDRLNQLAAVYQLLGVPKSFHAKLLGNLIQAFDHQLRGNVDAAREAYHCNVVLWDAEPQRIKHRLQDYTIALSNYLASCHRSDHFEEFETILPKLKGLSPQTFDEKAEVFQNLDFYTLIKYMNNLNDPKGKAFEDALDLASTLHGKFKLYDSKINEARRRGFYINLAVLHFIGSNYRAALDWVNKILIEAKGDHRKDIVRFAMLLEVTLYYEMHISGLVESRLRSTARALRSQKAMHQFEQTVLHNLKAVYECPPDNLKKKWRTFERELNEFAANGKGGLPFGHWEFTIWVRSKLTGRSLIDEFKANQNSNFRAAENEVNQADSTIESTR